MCDHFTPSIANKDIATFAGFGVHGAVPAFYILHIKNEACVSPRGNDVLLIASNLYMHTVLISAFFILLPGLN